MEETDLSAHLDQLTSFRKVLLGGFPSFLILDCLELNLVDEVHQFWVIYSNEIQWENTKFNFILDFTQRNKIVILIHSIQTALRLAKIKLHRSLTGVCTFKQDVFHLFHHAPVNQRRCSVISERSFSLFSSGTPFYAQTDDIPHLFRTCTVWKITFSLHLVTRDV